MTGYFVAPDGYEAFQRYRESRRGFAIADLTSDEVNAIAASRMDARHDHLNALLDEP